VSSRAQPAVTEIREQPRHKVFLPAEMSGAHGRTRVHLLNLSPAGALLHGDSPKAGATVQLVCAKQSWTARVIWTQQQRFGVVHVAPLGPGVMRTLVGERA
jgi:hypothetical protein